jgi:hypothetical protein
VPVLLPAVAGAPAAAAQVCWPAAAYVLSWQP